MFLSKIKSYLKLKINYISKIPMISMWFIYYFMLFIINKVKIPHLQKNGQHI